MPDDEPVADRPTSWPVSATRYLHRGDWVISLREDVVGRPEAAAGPVRAVDRRAPRRRRGARRRRRRSGCCACGSTATPGATSSSSCRPACATRTARTRWSTAQRELREEAELAATDWRLLLSTYPSAGLTEEVHEIYLARGLSHADRGDFELAAEEAEMEAFWVPMAELLDAVLDGRVREGPLAQAVLAYDVLQRRGALGEGGSRVAQRIAAHPGVKVESAGGAREGRRSQGSEEPRVPRGDHAGRGSRAHRARPRGLRREERGHRLADQRRGVPRRGREDPGLRRRGLGRGARWCSRSRSRSRRSTTGCARG